MLFFERTRVEGIPEIPGHEYPVRLKEIEIPVRAINFIDLCAEERGMIWTVHLGTGLKREFYDDDNPRLLAAVTKRESPDFSFVTPFSKNAQYVCVHRVVRIEEPFERLHRRLKDSEKAIERVYAFGSFDKIVARWMYGDVLSLVIHTHNEAGERIPCDLIVPRDVAKEVYRKNPKAELTCAL